MSAMIAVVAMPSAVTITIAVAIGAEAQIETRSRVTDRWRHINGSRCGINRSRRIGGCRCLIDRCWRINHGRLVNHRRRHWEADADAERNPGLGGRGSEENRSQ